MQNNRTLSAQIWRYALILAVFGAAQAMGQDASDAEELSSAFETGTIIIEAEKDACYRFDVYLAISREQQVRGLMHIRQLPEMRGMLFIYSVPAMRSMWMKNTYISLDILFIREDGTISNIEANTEPLSLTSISSTEPVHYVLELNAGVASKFRIKPDSLVHLQLAEGS